jgi:uncharacterized alpha-E superfamily protein
MISRVAESCFWLNRYVERAEVLSRMLGVNVAFALDVELERAECWRPLVIVSGLEADFSKRFDARDADDAEIVQEYLTWDEDNPASVISSLRMARENARTIRETISLEMWETLNDVWVWLGERESRRLYDRDRIAFYLRLRNQCLLFHGVAQATMLHEDPFEFMRLGTAIERIGQTARLLDVKHHSVGPGEDTLESPTEIAQWLAILRFCSGVEPFLKRRTAVPSGRAVAEFMLFDAAFARSVVHNLERAANFLDLVSPPHSVSTGARSRALLAETRAQLESMSIDTVLSEGLHDTLTWIVDTTADLTRAIHDDFFDPTAHGDAAIERDAGEDLGPGEREAESSA